jgi:hypothetical protein
MSKYVKAKIEGLRPQQNRLYRLLGQESPKPVHPKLALIFGYPLALIINQLLFWDGMGARKDGYIFKTEEDFIKEIGTSSAQQKLAIIKGKSYGFLDVKRKGVPAKRHYKLNFNILVDVIIQQAEIKGIVLSKSHFEYSEKHRSITERTQETTAIKTNASSISKIMADKFKKL